MSNENSNGAAAHGVDSQSDGFVAVGLELQALGATLVATGQLARKADRDKRKAVLAGTVPVVSGIIGDLEILKLGLRKSLGLR